MRRITVATIVASSFALAACADRDSTSPRAINPGQSSLATLPAPATTCDFTAIKTVAKSYFTSGKDVVYDSIAAMSNAYKTGGATAATPYGFAIGRVVARERLTPATTNGTAGRVFMIDVMRCMADPSSAVPQPSLTLDTGFTNHLDAVLNSGIWEVRGTVADGQFPAAGRVIDNLTHARAFGSPRWGVEPVSTWPAAFEYFVYGYPLNQGALVIGAATNINVNEVPKNSFELATIPALADHSSLRVGVCIHTDNVNTSTANRLVHNNNEVVDASALTSLCASSATLPGYVAFAPTSTSWFASLVNGVGSVLTPKNAIAQDDCRDCIGGLPSGWSPFSAGAISVPGVTFGFVTPPGPPANTTVGTPNTVIVQASVNGVAIPSVTVRLSIAGNNGNPAGATFEDGGRTKTGTTGANGQVTFNYAILKPGGYTITASGALDGFATPSAAAFINVKFP